jgi:uncharacterized membrane protein
VVQPQNKTLITGIAVGSAVEWTAMNPDTSGRLEEQVRELTTRVWRLENALQQYGIVVEKEDASAAVKREDGPAATPPIHPSTPPTERIEGPAQTVAPAMPLAGRLGSAGTETRASGHLPPEFPMPAPTFGIYGADPNGPVITQQKTERSLESRIGSQWFNRIGILAILIAVAWFLKMAFDNHWIGPLGRVLIGLAAGAGIIAWSERFQSRGFAGFAYSLKAVGSGILYLSLWAAFSVYQLVPAGAAFAAMILVTAFNGFMAWIQDAELLALYAIAGGLSTPLLLSTGENHEVTLFGYLLVIDIAVLVLVALKPWSRLLFTAFVGTVLFFLGWWTSFYEPEAFRWTAFFLTVFFLAFSFSPRLVRIRGEEGSPVSGWDSLALVLLPIGNAAFGFIGFYALFESRGSDWAGPWLAVAFAAYYLLLLQLPTKGRLRKSPGVLSSLHLTAAVVFLTIAIPLKAHGRWLTIGWLAEGGALLWVASRVRLRLLWVLALGCLGLGLGALLVDSTPASSVPLFNQRFGTYCVAIAVFSFTAWLALKSHRERGTEDSSGWQGLAAAAVLIVNALILLAISLEIHNYWWVSHWQGVWIHGRNNEMYAQFSYSAWFMLFGAILLGTGFWKNSPFLRWQALVLLAVSIAKVFLVDVSELAEGYRILSFLGLGALLLAVSYVYQRDWLNLRSQDRRRS